MYEGVQTDIQSERERGGERKMQTQTEFNRRRGFQLVCLDEKPNYTDLVPWFRQGNTCAFISDVETQHLGFYFDLTSREVFQQHIYSLILTRHESSHLPVIFISDKRLWPGITHSN